jgi:tetratricopeptide (TPR) repeat protein
MTPATPHLEAARQALDEGRPREALGHLTHGFGQDAGHRPLYALAATCLRRLGEDEEARLFEAALDDFHAAEPFYALGYHLVEGERYELALPFLERAHDLAPGRVDVALELAQTYTSRFRPQDARELLQRTGLRRDFWATYEFHWASLLCNRPQGVTDFVRDARATVAAAALDPGTRRSLDFALDKLEQVRARLVAFPAPRPRVQDWHFVQYGAAILDYFDDRTAAGGLEVAGGRWVALWGGEAHIAMVLHKLRDLLAALDRLPERVLGLPDRDAEIVGRAAALLLDRPYEAAPPEAVAQPHTLLVAADNRQLGDRGLLPVLEGQTVFALNLHWLHRGGATPDVAGVLSQYFALPWSGGMIQVDPETRETVRPAPDTRPPGVIAGELAATPPEEDPRFEEILSFYVARAAYLPGGPRGGGTRLPFLPDSPVPGTYFS